MKGQSNPDAPTGATMPAPPPAPPTKPLPLWTNQELQARVVGLERLVAEYIELDHQWDVQRVGKLCGAPLGTSIRAAVEPALVRLIMENYRQQSRIAELEQQAAIGRRAVEVRERELIRRAADILGSQGFSAWEEIADGLITILRDAEQTIDSPCHVRGATEMVTDQQLAIRVAELERAIQRMAEAGGRQEFQLAFDLAKGALGSVGNGVGL